jgi:hypothetical protein
MTLPPVRLQLVGTVLEEAVAEVAAGAGAEAGQMSDLVGPEEEEEVRDRVKFKVRKADRECPCKCRWAVVREASKAGSSPA